MVGKRDKALHNGPDTTVHVRMHQTPRRLFQGHERLMDIRRMVPRDDIQHRLHIGTLARLRVRLNRLWLRGEEAGNPRIDRKSNTSELQSLMRISYAVFCLKKKHSAQQSPPLTLTNRTY